MTSSPQPVSAQPRLLEMAGGRRVVLRVLSPADVHLISAAMEEAGPETLRNRFLGAAPGETTLTNLLGQVDGVRRYAIGAFEDETQLMAVAEWARVDETTAEIAIVVGERWRRHGLARAMLELVCRDAYAVGFRRLTATFLAQNE